MASKASKLTKSHKEDVRKLLEEASQKCLEENTGAIPPILEPNPPCGTNCTQTVLLPPSSGELPSPADMQDESRKAKIVARSWHSQKLDKPKLRFWTLTTPKHSYIVKAFKLEVKKSDTDEMKHLIAFYVWEGHGSINPSGFGDTAHAFIIPGVTNFESFPALTDADLPLHPKHMPVRRRTTINSLQTSVMDLNNDLLARQMREVSFDTHATVINSDEDGSTSTDEYIGSTPGGSDSSDIEGSTGNEAAEDAGVIAPGIEEDAPITNEPKSPTKSAPPLKPNKPDDLKASNSPNKRRKDLDSPPQGRRTRHRQNTGSDTQSATPSASPGSKRGSSWGVRSKKLQAAAGSRPPSQMDLDGSRQTSRETVNSKASRTSDAMPDSKIAKKLASRMRYLIDLEGAKCTEPMFLRSAHNSQDFFHAIAEVTGAPLDRLTYVTVKVPWEGPEEHPYLIKKGTTDGWAYFVEEVEQARFWQTADAGERLKIKVNVPIQFNSLYKST